MRKDVSMLFSSLVCLILVHSFDKYYGAPAVCLGPKSLKAGRDSDTRGSWGACSQEPLIGKGDVLVFLSCYTEYEKTGQLKQQAVLSHSFGVWEAQGHGAD